MNAILDTALGLALVYLLTSLFASSLQEVVARTLGSRGRFLREGLLSLITDRWVYLRTINHPSIVAFYRKAPGKGNGPSYLPSDAVAQVLCDVLVRRYQMQSQGGVVFNLEALKGAVRSAKEHDTTLGHALLPRVEGTETFEDALKAVAAWYEQGMDRVSGWYKVAAQKQLFVIGLVIAATLNIDTVAITESMARSPALRQQMAAAAQQAEVYRADVDRIQAAQAKPDATNAAGDEQKHLVDARVEQIEAIGSRFDELASAGLPIGYACLGPSASEEDGRTLECTLPKTWSSWLLKIVGFLLTAVAAALGAPFWFDLINRVVSLRGSGAKPPETKGA